MLFQPISNSMKRWPAVFVVSLSSALIIACGEGTSVGQAVPAPAHATAPGQPVYTMIFDAGSSGTRLSFYKVTPGPYPAIEMLSTLDFEDNGINDYLNDTGTVDPAVWPSDARPADCRMTAASTDGGVKDVGPCVLQPLLMAMNAKMVEQKVDAKQVKVELFATAGMRTMEQYNGGKFAPSAIKAFYAEMKKYTEGKGFNVGDFKTIDGNKEEGVWTWVNLNDQYYNAFGGNTTYHTGAPEARGNFEVGGSSMQVAFPTETIKVDDVNNVYRVTINSKTYNVFSKTYLGLGGDDARKFVRAYGFDKVSTAGYTGVDCFGSNATASNAIEDSGVTLFKAPFYSSNNLPVDNATGVEWKEVLSNTAAGTPLVLSGPGRYNLKTCTAKYNEVTQAVMALPRNNGGAEKKDAYADLAAKVGQSSAPFVGLDNFYFATSDLKLVPKGQVKTPISEDQVKKAIATVCPDGGAGPAGTKLKALRVCPDAAYMYNFLWQNNTAEAPGLFGPGRTAKYDGVVPSKVNKESVLSWTRGYLLLTHAAKAIN